MSEERFWGLVNQLRENYRVGAHTRGPCCNPDCSNSSDGGGKCGECCSRELAKLTGNYDAATLFMLNTKENMRLLSQMLESLKS